MFALRVGFLVASCVAGAAIAQEYTVAKPGLSTPTGYEQLATLAKQGGASPTAETLRQTADVLIKTSSSARDLSPVGLTPDLEAALADVLVDAQSAWLSDKGARSISTKSLTSELNRQLDLENAPEYMGVRPEQLRRIRVKMWWRVPDFMVSSPKRTELSAGMRVAHGPMSPFEAFLIADALLHEKLYNDDYLRTEEEVKALPMYPSEHRAPGLYKLPHSERRDAFRSHLDGVANTKWQGAQSVLDSLRTVLEVRHAG